MDRTNQAPDGDHRGEEPESRTAAEQRRLEIARRIAHETFVADHQALEVDTRPGFRSLTTTM